MNANRFGRPGLTLIELLVCTVIIGILSMTALPLSKHFVRSQKEDLLKEALRDLREAIDRHYDKMQRRAPELPEEQKYPSRLQSLLESRSIRRIPLDPFTGRREWGTRSSTDPVNASYTDGMNIFDVYSLATATALDGRAYSDW
ncbi:MAG TPA: prepilin-type N-terminal cleavage/methylation domain-containing protein [Candidatus Ozemobacteraceae bacterium]|nr:prepilin-type N-terminal cleavage/methylation domain-containing protein [Candidatus Ozemobacteraceae bacterium]